MSVSKVDKIVIDSDFPEYFELEKTSVNFVKLNTYKNKELVSSIVINNFDINDIIEFLEPFRT